MTAPFAPDRPLQLELLGGIALRGAVDADALLAQTKRVALLAYLAVAKPRGYHRRDVIATLFWPEHDTGHARAALRRAVFDLRQSLGEEAVRGRGDEKLALNRDLVWCDVAALEEAAAADAFARVLELYRGPLMPGFFADAPGFERWLDDERSALRDLATRCAWSLADLFDRQANATVAIKWAKQAAKLGQYDERVIRKVIQLLDRAGARADAMKIYDDFARALREEFEIEPSAETRALADALRAG